MAKPLTKDFVERIKAKGRYGDGHGGNGLSLNVHPMKNSPRIGKSWVQKLRINGRKTAIGLGSYPRVSLAEARKIAIRNIRLLDQGIDPREAKETAMPTFLEASEKVLAEQRWKNQERETRDWRSLIERYCQPIIRLPVDKISSMEILEFLHPIWLSKRSVGRTLKLRLHMIFNWEITQGHIETNPMTAIDGILPKNGHSTTHQASLPYADIPSAITKIRDLENEPVRLALEFTILTAARSSEVRGADWDEVDFATNVWTIPPERMKTKKEHRVPLSPRAVEILERAREMNEHSHLVFPSATNGGQIANSTLTKLTRRLDLGTVHGFRSSFRNWCAETNQSRDLAERSLAHTVRGVEAAYFRSDLLEQRRDLMNAWSEHCAG